MLVAQALILRARLGNLPQFERKLQSVKRGPPQLAFGQALAEYGQAVGFLRAAFASLIRNIGSGGCALQQYRALAVIGAADLQDGLRQTQPVPGIVGRYRHCLPEQLQGSAEIGTLESRLGVAPQLRRGPARLPGIAFDLRLQPERGIGQITALESFILGGGRQTCENGKRGDQASAG